MLLLVGCSQSTDKASDKDFVESAAAEQALPAQSVSQTSGPRRLKLTLSLDRPEDLKVREQESVAKGRVLSDRKSARDRLINDRRSLLAKLDQFRQQQDVIASSGTQPSTATEQAEVNAAQVAVTQAQRAIEKYRDNSPWTEYARSVLLLPDNQELAELGNKYQVAQAELEIAQAKLQDAQQSKESKKTIDTTQQQADTISKLREVDGKISTLGVVHSPYSGVIKSIRWLGQKNQELQVELTLAMGSTSTPESKSTTATQPLPPERKPPTSTAPKTASKPISITWSVISIHDGDTMRVRSGSKVERVRFACIDAPELGQELGKVSRDHLRELTKQSGNQVLLNIVDTDRYGRKVAEVYTPGGQLIQEQQTRDGMVYLYERYINNCPSADKVKAAQSLAKQQNIGVWSSPRYRAPWDYRKSL